MYLEPIQQRLIALNRDSSPPLCGCTPEEIRQLEQRLGVKLPSAYQEFLRMMGKGQVNFYGGQIVSMPR